MTVALDVLMQRAITNPSDEPAFLRALLDAELYVHRPEGDDDDRLRIVQFNRPDGLQVIPVFTDLFKARAASSPSVEIVGLKGRVLFEATRGATFMLNPNDTTCTLYPEEIADLLSGRPVARAPIAGNAAGVEVEPANDDDLWICQRRLKSDPLDRFIADSNLTHPDAHGLRWDRTVPALRLSFSR